MSFQTEREMLFLERNRYIQVCRENEYAVLYYDNKEEKIIRYKTGKKFSFSLKYQLCILVTLYLGYLLNAKVYICLLYTSPSGFSIINTLIMAVVVFAVIYVITMISVHKPAKLAAAVSPMEALRYTAQDDMKKTANKKMCRNLTPLGLGVMNFSKNKKKAVITMLSLALGGILFLSLIHI